MIGPRKLPRWLKKAYLKAVNYTCEDCYLYEKEDDPLEVHRIVRGNKGGTYRPGNVKVVHKRCHKKYHAGEFK